MPVIRGINSRYEIIYKIGSGGMSTVYLAKDKEMNRKVAIKVLLPSAMRTDISKKRFNNEVKLHNMIDSPYVVKTYDSEIYGDTKYLVMEYVFGETLNNYISYRQSLNVDEVVDIAKEILLGLNEIHQKGILHRDLKSSNIIITHSGSVKIIDLGIARDDSSAKLTKTDNIIGSSEYIAPEISQGDLPSRKSDYYALGILIYQMLTGSVPFSGSTPAQVLRKHINQEIPMVNKIALNVPQSLANVVARATAKDLENRYDNFLDFYHDLVDCLNDNKLDEKPVSFHKKQHNFSFHDFVTSRKVLVILIFLAITTLTIAIALIAILLEN